MGRAEGEDGGDERDRRHPNRAGRAQIADILLPQGGQPAGDVGEGDGDAVVSVAAQPRAFVADNRLLLLFCQDHWHGVFKDQDGAVAVSTTLLPAVGGEEREVCSVVRVNGAWGEGEVEGGSHLLHLKFNM